jgi:hypothetical protein
MSLIVLNCQMFPSTHSFQLFPFIFLDPSFTKTSFTLLSLVIPSDSIFRLKSRIFSKVFLISTRKKALHQHDFYKQQFYAHLYPMSEILPLYAAFYNAALKLMIFACFKFKRVQLIFAPSKRQAQSAKQTH